MRRPVRSGHLTVTEAINMVIRDRFADRHAAIEQRVEAEEEARKKASVSTGDPIRDAVIQRDWKPSRQLQQLVDEVFSDAQYLLRQWLCDGHLQAFYRDPLLGRDDIQVEAAAWEVEATDEAIGGGKFYPYGRSAGRPDQNAGAPVKLLRSDLEKLLHDTSAASRTESKPKVGAPETAVLRVIDAMLKAPRDHWDGQTYDSMAVTFGASPTTVKKARERVRQQLDEKATGD